MSRPVVSEAAERMYATLDAFTDGDEDSGWIILHRCEARARMLASANALLRSDDTGSGMRRAKSPARAPALALPWLSQHAGIPSIDDDLTEAQTRELIADAPGMRRGTPGAFESAARRYLTGYRVVVIIPRDGGSRKITVVTRTDETADAAAVLRALLTQKPGTFTLTHVVADGEIWNEAAATWDDVDPGVTWDDVATTSI